MICSTRHHARAAAVLAAAFGVLTFTGCAATAPPAPPPAAVSSPRPTTPTRLEAPTVPQVDANIGAVKAQPVIPPTHISLPSLSIGMDVTPVATDSTGGLEIPSDSNRAGWYRFGPGMFQSAGSVVIAAHVDSWNGIGPFAKIKDASAGSPVILTGDGRTQTFQVTEVQEVPKLGDDMSTIFDKAGPSRLVMVTCGGVFNRATGHYLDNVILIATPTGA